MAEDPNKADWRHTVSTLGSAIVSWSHCEEATEHLLRDLLEHHGLDREVARIVASTLDLRHRCALGLALAYKLHPPRDVMDKLSTALNCVQNDLRSMRNRLFHDSWMYKEETIHKRKSTGPKLERPQHKELELVVPAYSPVDLQDVIDFSRRCIDLSGQIHDLLSAITKQFYGEKIAQLEAQRAELDAQSPRQRRGLIHRLRHIFGKR